MLTPILFRWIRDLRSALIAFAGASVLSITLGHLFGGSAPNYFFVLWFPAEFPVFLLGIATYLLSKRFTRNIASEVDNSDPSGRRDLSAVLLVAFACILFLSVNLSASGSDWADHHMLPSAIMFPFLILALVLHPWKFLNNRVTRFLGKISYSIYLSHGFIAWWLDKEVLSRTNIRQELNFVHGGIVGALLFLLCLMLLDIPCSVVLWNLVEQPGIRLGRRLIAALEHRTATRKALLPQLQELSIKGNTSDAQF